MNTLASAFKVLGDDTRLRILRLIHVEPLNVSELTAILGLAQSGISRHLSVLRRAGLVEEQRLGAWTYYRIPSALSGRDNGNGRGPKPERELAGAWSFVAAQFSTEPDPFGDLARLEEVLRQRENHGGRFYGKLLEPGQSWFAWTRALHLLLPSLDVIDLGCGDGAMTLELGRFSKSVMGIDNNPAVLTQCRRRAAREGVDTVRFEEASMEALPAAKASFDLAVMSQSLHYLQEPKNAVNEALRVLRPGGKLLVLDLAAHTHDWVQEKLGHVHLGFTPDALTGWMKAAGFKQVACQGVMQRRGEPFRVLLATGHKPT